MADPKSKVDNTGSTRISISSLTKKKSTPESNPNAQPTFPEPAELAKKLKYEGWPVPGFLLFPGDPRHVRPLVALSVLTNMLEAAGERLEPYVYHPPTDPRHVPPYIAALERQRRLWELQNLHPHPKSTTMRDFRAKLLRFWTPFQYVIGTAISLSSIAVTFHSIKAHKYALDIPPVAMAIIFVILLIIIAYSEGYHVTIITLEKADSNVFKNTHPRAYATHSMANKNAENFVVGRQVLLTFVVFVVATVNNFAEAEYEGWLFFPASFMSAIMKTGVAPSLIVLAFGQLLPQIIATAYPIHHQGLPGGIVLVWLMLFFDKIGIANIGFWGAYLWRKWRGIMVNEEFGIGGDVVFGVGEDGKAKATPASIDEEKVHDPAAQDVVKTVKAGKKDMNAGAHIGGEASGEIHRRVRNDPVEIAKLCFSVGIMLVATAFALRRIIMGQSGLKAPWPVLIVIHIILLIGMMYLEGMNLCVLALEKVPNEQVAVINPNAVAAHKLISADGDSVRRFLLGRQFCVVWMDFLINEIGGLYSVAITVFLAQVMSQIVAATNPCYWMALPGARFMLLLSLSVERIGVCHFGWVVGLACQWFMELVGILKPEPFSVGKKVNIKGSSVALADEDLVILANMSSKASSSANAAARADEDVAL
eukprot:c12873_g1_i1.p1 GENE.c12873_g1_i1~~c12873_g1_i1.p1  ORF type:complete len:663 (+),score=223.06 c12873_g1_i1:47-1990(+)